MAQQTVLTCDITGEPGAVTMKFSVDGRVYEIDLSESQKKVFEEALLPFKENARSGRALSSAPRAARSAPSQNLSAVRAWAADNGWQINTRGRIPGEVLAAYEASQAASPKPKKARAPKPASAE